MSEIDDLLDINSCSDSDTNGIDIQTYSNKSITSLKALFLDSNINKVNKQNIADQKVIKDYA